jgi:BlaI family penicillinase repressor
MPPAITDAEWELMYVLWSAAGPLTAGEVVDAVAGRRSPRTIKALLNRLLNKGAVSAEAQGNRYLYRPAVARAQCIRAAGRSFLARVFGGSAAPLLAHFVTHADLSADEVEQLQKLLAAKKPGGRRRTQKDR